MKKQTDKQKRQTQRQQKKASSKNSARYRKRNDGVYREAHRDDLIRHQIRVGHSPQWIAVLNGTAPGIVLPVGEVDSEALETCRQAVLDMHGEPAPETVHDPEFDQYLSPEQLKTLDQGMPVIMMAYVERQFDTSVKRSNSLLQNRVRDAIEFGIGQSVQYIGRLWLAVEDGKNATAGMASTEALTRFSESWAPQYEGEEADRWSGYVENLKAAGSLHERADHFVNPTIRHDLIKSEIRSITGVNSTVKIERQFWHTTILGLINCKNHDGPQASAHRRISRSYQTEQAVERADALEFMGVRRAPVTLIDLMALAYFEMPDVYRLFPTFHFHFPDFEALAALGALTRGRAVRIDAKTARRMGEILSWPKYAGVGSDDTVPEVLNAEQFIRHAMTRVGPDDWWMQVLQSPADNFGVRHFRKGESLAPVTRQSGSLGISDHEMKQTLAKLLVPLSSQFALRFGRIDGVRAWHYIVPGNAMFLDFDHIDEYSRGDDGLVVLTLVDALAAGLHHGLGLDEFQTMSSQLPGYYREMVRIAAASHAVMQVFAPRLCERRALDLLYYARFLTDREYETARLHGESTGHRILKVLGVGATARKSAQSRHH